MVQMDYAGKLQRCHGYVEALEEERRKIQVFQRELPLCLELLSHAIEACRRDLSGAATSEYLHGQSECSEQTSSEGPVLAEFIPIKKRTSSCSDGNDDYEINGEQQSNQRNRISDNGNSVKDQNNCDLKKKSEWLRSVQLWNQSPDPPPKVDVPRKVVVTEMQINSGAFQPFHRESSVGKSNNNRTPADVPNAVPASATTGTAETAVGGGPSNGGTSGKEGMEEQQPQRKQRRCWSPELHRRFLSALQQLGGSQAATPKQIRELMKVDGLTNDEVKSHLQKYRLHTRRPSPTIHNNGTPQAHQFIVVGGIWPPPPEYTAVAATITSGETATIAKASGICAPAAAAPPEAPQVDISSVQKPDPAGSKKLQSEGRGSQGEGGSHSSSPSPSSFTHAMTNSPVF